MDDPVLRLDRSCKAYNVGLPSDTKVLHDIDLTLKRVEFLAQMGPTGSGKSTLLNIIGLLDRPTSGHLFIKGLDTALLNDAALKRLRGRAHRQPRHAVRQRRLRPHALGEPGERAHHPDGHAQP